MVQKLRHVKSQHNLGPNCETCLHFKPKLYWYIWKGNVTFSIKLTIYIWMAVKSNYKHIQLEDFASTNRLPFNHLNMRHKSQNVFSHIHSFFFTFRSTASNWKKRKKIVRSQFQFRYWISHAITYGTICYAVFFFSFVNHI